VQAIFTINRGKNGKAKDIIQMLDCIKDANSSNLKLILSDHEVSHKDDNDRDNENSVDEFESKSTLVHVSSTNEN
jgi:hypothetical protein